MGLGFRGLGSTRVEQNRMGLVKENKQMGHMLVRKKTRT